MPEYIRALIVILVLATIVFTFAHRSACDITGREDFIRRRNLWFALTLAAFLTQNYWLYTFIAIPLLIYAGRRESNTPALYFILLFVFPVAVVPIPGMGLINNLFELSHARILSLLILLPAFLILRRQNDTLAYGRSSPDKILAAYLLLVSVLYLRELNITNNLRQIFYLFIDIFLVYFVISRSLKNIQAFRVALMSLVLIIMVTALLAIFESYKHWLLYATVIEVLNLEGDTQPLGRDGLLRAMVMTGQPIALGYVMVVGMGLYLFIQHSIQSNLVRRAGMLLLIAGLIAPFSRGPWIGAVLLIAVFVATGRFAVRRMVSLAVVAILALALISSLPGGERVINLLPYIGTTERGNIDYREQLFTNSMIVIQRNLWFGSTDFFQTPEMEAMRQGQGIIDVTNTYLGVTLKTGFIGLGLFVGFFAMTIIGIHRAMRSIPDKESEEYLLGRVLLASLLATMLIIVTVASITFIPIVYWSVAAMGVAYAQMVRKNAAQS